MPTRLAKATVCAEMILALSTILATQIGALVQCALVDIHLALGTLECRSTLATESGVCVVAGASILAGSTCTAVCLQIGLHSIHPILQRSESCLKTPQQSHRSSGPILLHSQHFTQAIRSKGAPMEISQLIRQLARIYEIIILATGTLFGATGGQQELHNIQFLVDGKPRISA